MWRKEQARRKMDRVLGENSGDLTLFRLIVIMAFVGLASGILASLGVGTKARLETHFIDGRADLSIQDGYLIIPWPISEGEQKTVILHARCLSPLDTSLTAEIFVKDAEVSVEGRKISGLNNQKEVVWTWKVIPSSGGPHDVKVTIFMSQNKDLSTAATFSGFMAVDGRDVNALTRYLKHYGVGAALMGTSIITLVWAVIRSVKKSRKWQQSRLLPR